MTRVRSLLTRDERKTKRRWALATQASMLAVVLVAGVVATTQPSADNESWMTGRRALSGDDDKEDDVCADIHESGAVDGILHAAGTLYIFVGLALVCDEFFQPALEEISEALSLSPDVAGATFLAAGSSAPELFTSLADAFGDSTSIGISTIVGSAMFNILVIVALSCAVAGQGGASLLVDWRPVFRDVGYYVMSILVLVLFFFDEEITPVEAAIMVLLYGTYIVFMVYNQRIFAVMARTCEKRIVPEMQVDSIKPSQYEMAPVANEAATGDVKQPDEGDQRAGDPEAQPKVTPAGDAESAEKAEEEDEDEGPVLHRFEVPDGVGDKILFALNVPFLVVFTLFIPDCQHSFFTKKFKKIYWVTFTMSIVFIALLCHFMVEYALVFACVMDWNPLIIGLLVLSVGTSIPDAIGSMIAAKNGEADMAVANAVGSNVFDILLGLGAPWLGVTLWRGRNQEVDKGGVILYTIILLITVVIFVGILVASRWKLNSQVGLAMLALYGVFVIIGIILA